MIDQCDQRIGQILLGLMQGEGQMKQVFSRTISRVCAAMLAAMFLMGLSFAGTASPVFVSSASELITELNKAADSGDDTTIYYMAGTSLIELSGSSVTIPSNVTLDLSTTVGTLRISSGELNVYGTIAGGAVEVTGGTLVRGGGSITASITTSGTGMVRAPRTISLENLNSDSEVIVAITYSGVTGADTSGYVNKPVSSTLYTLMTGTKFSTYRTIETVTTYLDSTGSTYVYRLGTKYSDTLSLAYLITYGGLTGASLSELNPTSYTASDSAILLNNPTMDGFTFAGWTCDALGVTVPATEMVIPAGTTGNLTLIANWTEGAPTGGGRSGASGSSGITTTDTEDAATQQEAAAAADTASTQSTSTRRTKVASSSTKVSFSSNSETVLPTLASVSKKTFPWGLTLGGLAGLGAVIYIAVKLAERKKQM